MKPTITTDSATISTTEYFVVADSTTASYQTEDADVEFWFDAANIAAGDEFYIRVYDKVNGGTATCVWFARPIGVQPCLIKSPRLTLAEGWEASIQKVAGTDRAIGWSIRKFTEGETVVTGSISANAITAAATAADFGTEVAAAVFAYAHEVGRTFLGAVRRMEAFVAGKATGLVGASAVFYRADASTAAITATQDVDAGTREAATVGGD
jgi:hypothetical protein